MQFQNNLINKALVGAAALICSSSPLRSAEMPKATDAELSTENTSAKKRLIYEISINLKSFDAIPSVFLKDGNVLAACLDSERLRDEALKKIKPEDLVSKEVRAGILKAMTQYSLPGIEEFIGKRLFWFDNSDFRNEFIEQVKNDKAALWSVALLLRVDIPVEHRPGIVAALEDTFKQRIRELDFKDSERVMITIGSLPDDYLQDLNFSRFLAEVFSKHPECKSYSWVGLSNLPLSEKVELLELAMKDGKLEMQKAMHFVPANLWIGAWRDKVIPIIKQQFSLLSNQPDFLLEDPEIKGLIKDAILKDPRLILHISHKKIVNSLIAENCKDPAYVQKIATLIKSDLLSIPDYPKLILHQPVIQYVVRAEINYRLARGRGLGCKGQDLSYFLYSTYKDFPDILNFSDFSKSITTDEMTLVNPSFGMKLIQKEVSLTPRAMGSLSKIYQVSDILKIYSYGRFDNARELIRNRYLLSSKEEQQQLREILGSAFASEYGEKYLENTKFDARPPLVVIYPQVDNDWNGAFKSQNAIIGIDNIDELTAHYQVFYFEVSTNYEAIEAIINTSKALGRKLDAAIIAGHGSRESISLGRGDLSVNDKKMLQELPGSLAENAIIYLLSCSTGKGAESESDGENIAQTIRSASPGISTIAPDRPVAGFFKLDEKGAIIKIEYIGGKGIRFNPDGSQDYVSGMSTVELIAKNFFVSFEYNMRQELYATLGSMAFTFLSLSIVANLFRRAKKYVLNKRERRRQLFEQPELF